MNNKELSSFKLTITFIILIVGFIGNGINLKVFTNKDLYKSLTFKYLLFLTIVDSLLLASWSSGDLFIHIHSDLMIKCQQFLTCLLSQMSNLILMAAVLNETISKMNPNITISLITFILILINFHFLIFFNESIKINELTSYIFDKREYKHICIMLPNLIHSNNSQISTTEYSKSYNQTMIAAFCKNYDLTNLNYHYFLDKIWIWFESIVFTFIPFLVITITLIMKQKHRHQTDSRTRRSNNDQDLMKFFILANIFILIGPIQNNLVSKILNNDETNALKTTIEFVSYLKHSISCLIYLITINDYRKLAFKFKNMTRQNEINSLEMNNHPNECSKYCKQTTRDVYTQKKSSIMDIVWVDIDYFKKNNLEFEIS